MGFFDFLAPVAGGIGGFLLGGPGGAAAGASLGSSLVGRRQQAQDSSRARELQERAIQNAQQYQDLLLGEFQKGEPLRDRRRNMIGGFTGMPGNPFSQQLFGQPGAAPVMTGATGTRQVGRGIAGLLAGMGGGGGGAPGGMPGAGPGGTPGFNPNAGPPGRFTPVTPENTIAYSRINPGQNSALEALMGQYFPQPETAAPQINPTAPGPSGPPPGAGPGTVPSRGQDERGRIAQLLMQAQQGGFGGTPQLAGGF